MSTNDNLTNRKKSPNKSPEWQREYRRRRNAAGKPVHAEWYARSDVKARIKAMRAEWKAKPETKAKLAEYDREFRSKPENVAKNRARWAVKDAVRSGALVRLPCEVCGDPETEGHHEDYTKPLDVRWLCRSHHQKAHGGTFKPVTAFPHPTPN